MIRRLAPRDGVARFLPEESGRYEIKRIDLDEPERTVNLTEELDPEWGCEIGCPCYVQSGERAVRGIATLARVWPVIEARVNGQLLPGVVSVALERVGQPLILTDIGFVCPRGKECPIGHRYEVTVERVDR